MNPDKHPRAKSALAFVLGKPLLKAAAKGVLTVGLTAVHLIQKATRGRGDGTPPPRR